MFGKSGCVMRSSVLSLLLLVATATTCARAADRFVAPDGVASNAGTRESPWDLASALGGAADVRAGDTVWLRGGAYRQPWKQGEGGQGFVLKLRGTPDAPVTVRACAGERATLDGLQVAEPAEYVWVRDLEIAGSGPIEQRETKQTGSAPTDLPGPLGGLNVMAGRGCKFINLVIHDNLGGGVGFWRPAVDCELYGCLIYSNGWRAPDRNHGHCIYTQNETGRKTISDCIMSTPYGDGQQTVQAYGSSRAFVDNFVFRHNVAHEKGRFLIGGGRPSHAIRVESNYLYKVALQLGYNAPENEDCEVVGNVIFRGGLSINRFKTVVNRDNLVVTADRELPERAACFWLPNRYDANRAHLVVYNWRNDADASVPAAPFLKRGERFVLKDPRAPFSPPVFEGTCTADSIAIPMAGEFAVFVVLKERRGPDGRP